jgi:hypothetical protein
MLQPGIQRGCRLGSSDWLGILEVPKVPTAVFRSEPDQYANYAPYRAAYKPTFDALHGPPYRPTDLATLKRAL